MLNNVCTHNFWRLFWHSLLFLPSRLPCSSPSFHRNTSPKWLTLFFSNCIRDVIQVDLKCYACLQKWYTSINDTQVYYYLKNAPHMFWKLPNWCIFSFYNVLAKNWNYHTFKCTCNLSAFFMHCVSFTSKKQILNLLGSILPKKVKKNHNFYQVLRFLKISKDFYVSLVGIRWPLFWLFTSQFTDFINYICTCSSLDCSIWHSFCSFSYSRMY